IRRLARPYKTNCTERYLPGYRVYSNDGCISQCLSNKTIKDCGCRPIAEPGYPEVPVCSIADSECGNYVKDNLRYRTCYCSPPCHETYYQPRTSLSKFPNELVLQVLKLAFKLNLTEEYMRENLVYLQVGFAEISYEVHEQTPAYGLSSFF
ncbi:hypothetical protein QZH41_011560, partial [Actinostola sp. cb2023]